MKNNIVDSSGWLEYFADAKNAKFFSAAIENSNNLIVPTISIHEVFKHILRHCSEREALEAIQYMLKGKLIDLNLELGLDSAKLSVIHKIPLADSIILATGLAHNAMVWTQDADFEGLPHVKYIRKQS